MRLKVRNFSCLRDVDVWFKDVTVLIGEQGSGKSVLYKLAYYLVSRVSRLTFVSLMDDLNSDPSGEISSQFTKWFPQETWGNDDFEIDFQIGKAGVFLYRQNNRIIVDLNQHLLEEIEGLRQDFRYFQYVSDQDTNLETAKKGGVHRLVDFLIKELGSDFTKRTIGEGVSTNQVYVPAGRSLFTSLSKTASVLTEADGLDEVTKLFAKHYLTGLEGIRKSGFGFVENTLFQTIFKGDFLSEDNIDYIVTEDGRRVPLNILSSGQQEAFPLLALLCAPPFANRREGGVLYVEELEAHLFPRAQGDLLEFLVKNRDKSGGFDKLFLSTHSPYVLSKLNNLILAGQIHNNFPQYHQKLKAIVNDAAWLGKDSVAAYELSNGESRTIIDDDTGLIDGEYLDSFSFCLEEELDSLLELDRSAN